MEDSDTALYDTPESNQQKGKTDVIHANIQENNPACHNHEIILENKAPHMHQQLQELQVNRTAPRFNHLGVPAGQGCSVLNHLLHLLQ